MCKIFFCTLLIKEKGLYMAITAINTINFKGNDNAKVKDSQNSEGSYKTSNIGKSVGLGVGAIIPGGYGLRFINNVNKSVSLKKILVKYLDFGVTSFSSNSSVKDFLDSIEVSRQDYRKSRYKVISRGLKILPVVLAAAGMLVGLGIGAVADCIIDKFHAKKTKTDKVA